MDDFTWACMVVVAATSLSGAMIVRKLDILTGKAGAPNTIVSNKGTKFALVEILS